MSDAIDHGGPAFPQPACDTGHAANTPYGIAGGGISARDYFAAAALTGLLAASDPYFGTVAQPHDPWPWFAAESYRAADAMLAASSATTGIVTSAVRAVAK